ncbi:Predicted acetyltransferases and hydrolases with the alpha/beta hydrolase fold [Phaffia rhodozyma]|uniref:Protein phosphatase methylesterase 1 n=1 Tax=Phaffia rhodozyma TaxID=264483 RepID=A0A0F7SP50_PHARH|nr:Predicted acetyltransferases and hydrolases with the alpha/beta hydrolase fold [Phaffia rhodozyma]
MSEFQRDFMRTNLAKLPHLPPLHPNSQSVQNDGHPQEDLTEIDDDLPELGTRARSNRSHRRPPNRPPSEFPSAVPSYFAQSFSVDPPPSSDVSSAWSAPSFKTYYTPPEPASDEGPGSIMIFHHGGGEGALGFAVLAKEITRLTRGELGLLAFDCRGHGSTANPDKDQAVLDLSLNTLTADFLVFIRTMFPNPKKTPALVLIGHSMGAAPVLGVTPTLQTIGYKVAGVGVLDVVEGSALEALPLMPAIILSRPSSFASVDEAIDWHLGSNTYRSPTSARLSVPSIVQPTKSEQRVIWRTSLLDSAPYWHDWYKGLSAKFLAVRSARLLVLAGSDRIDKELMIGQMQGKFQHVVLPNVGHHIQQDDPERLAEVLVDFWRRNEGVNLKGIKKVGET